MHAGAIRGTLLLVATSVSIIIDRRLDEALNKKTPKADNFEGLINVLPTILKKKENL